jgi:ectoine hydroxylase-related dioxygenase (phytanoyl-CoA dioxygenase family)
VTQQSLTRTLLSPSELDAYRRDGQVTPAFRLSEGLMTRLRAAIEGLIADNPDVRPEQLVGAHIAKSADTGVRGREELLACAQHPDLLDMAEQILGPDLIMWGSQVFSKPAGDGLAIPWHQDGQYWPMRPLATVTAWIAIDPAIRENGCLRVIPGTHRLGLLAHDSSQDESLALNQGLADGVYDDSKAVDIELEPGQVSLHDSMLIHGSNANPSGRRRCGYAIRYMPATSHFQRDIPPTRIAHNQVLDFSKRPIWLVRGRDRAGNDFQVGHAEGVL